MIPESGFAAVSVGRWRKGGAEMSSPRHEANLKICAFRIITEDLLDKDLITQEEAAKIRARISAMETDLIKAEKPQDAEHLREQSAA